MSAETEHFFIVGAQRAGTTYLYQLLAEHPEIEMALPVRPEPKFFLMDELFERGVGFYKAHFFKGKPGARVRGEKSTSYMESEKAAERIAAAFPDAKIIFLLRDPIERAVSNYWFSVQNGLETLPMAEAFEKEDERREQYDHERTSVSPFAYLQRGRYIEYIEMYERHIPPDRMKAIIFEGLVTDRSDISDIYSFLGVAEDFVPPSLGKVINEGEKGDSTLSPQLRGYLVNYFAGPNERLAKRLGVDLGKWWRG
ncbi:MAG: sulfotransferase [Planctomycetota bacterium]